LVNFDALQDYSYFVELYALVYGERTTDIPSLFEEQHKTTSVSNMANVLAADDQLPGDIKQHENDLCLTANMTLMGGKLLLCWYVAVG